MDDGGAAACTIVLFFALLLIEAILYGFSKAIYLMNEKEIERRAQEENDKKSIALLGIVQHSTIYVNSIQMIIDRSGHGLLLFTDMDQLFYRMA